MNTPKTYLLRISAEHARAVLHALYVYHRLAMGDFHELSNAFEGKNGDWKKQRAQGLDEAIDRVKAILAPDLSPRGHNYGYGGEKTGKIGQLVYEVHKCMQHRIAWTETPPNDSHGMSNAHYDPILFPSGATPRPECAAESGEQPELARSPYKLARSIEEIVGTRDLKEAEKILGRWRHELEVAGFIESKKGSKKKAK